MTSWVGLAEQVVAEVGAEVVHDAGAFVVRVPPIDVFVGHGRQRVKPVVLHVAFFQHKLLVVFDQIDKRFVPVLPLHEQVAAVFGGPFFEPHVVVDRGCDQIAPPVVPQFVREQVAVGEVALLDHEPRVGDVGRNLQRAIGGQDVAHTLPGVGTPPVFERVNGVSEVGEFLLHDPGVRRLAGQAHRDLPVRALVGVVEVHVGAYSYGAEVCWNGVIQNPGA